jgi:guanylate cyclase
VIGKRKFVYDVWGDTVNTASRMESHSEPGRIQASDTAHALLDQRFRMTPRGSIEVKGKGPMSTFFLEGPR